MKILIIGNSISVVIPTRQELVDRLLAEGNEIIVSVPEKFNDGDFGFKTVQNPITRFGTNPAKELDAVKAIKSQIKDIQPDVVLTFTIKPNLYTLMAAGRKVPVISNITGLSAFLFRKGLVPKIVGGMQKYYFKTAICLFCQNMETYSQFKSLGFDNIELLPGSGVNVNKIKYTSYPEFKDKIECCFVARVQKDKGFNEFVEASKQLPDYHFTVVGDGEDKDIVDAFSACSNITYLGKIPHEKALEVIANSHLLILPSYHEGMANVILEAHALGRPVLTTNVAGCIDAIDDGKSGFSFEAKSAKAIVDACKRFASLTPEEWEQMGVAGRHFVEQNFDREIVVTKYLDVIAKAVGC